MDNNGKVIDNRTDAQTPTPLNAASAGFTHIIKTATEINIIYPAIQAVAVNNLAFDISFKK